MSDVPRFENIDLTPTWDDVDPAELDFAAGATDLSATDVGDADFAELDPSPRPATADTVDDTDLEIPPGPPSMEDDVDVELPPPVETPMEDRALEDGSADEFAGLDDADRQFADGPIGEDSVPDDFDL